MPLDANLKTQLQEFTNAALAEIADSASQLLNSKVTLSFATHTDSATASGTLSVVEPSILLSSNLSSEELGTVSVLMNSALASALASQMTGSEPAEELDDTQKEALVSLLNQSFSSITSVEDNLKPSNFNLSVLDPANPDSLNIDKPSTEMTAIKINLGLDTGFNSDFTLELSIDLVTSLTSSNNQSEAAPSVKAKNGTAISDTDFAEIQDNTNLGEVDEEKNLNLLMDIRMGMIVELGRAEMPLKDILKLTKGSIIELDRLSGEAVDLFVNNKLIARGEVVVIDDNFGLRITQLAGTKSSRTDELGLLAAGE